MAIPGFLLRKLYKRGTLRETADGRFSFSLHNPLAAATLIGPPTFVINGMHYPPQDVGAQGIPLDEVSPDNPLIFEKGDELQLVFKGRLLRGGNRIHLTVDTEEFGEIDVLVEDREAAYCDLPVKEEE